MRHMPSSFCFSNNLVYAHDLCALTRRWYASVYLWWKTPDIGHILNENIYPRSIILSIGSIIRTPTWYAQRHLSSTQSMRLTLRQKLFMIFSPCAFTSITTMFTHCSLWSLPHQYPRHQLWFFLLWILTRKEIIIILNSHVNTCSNHQTTLQNMVILHGNVGWQ